MSQSSRAEFGGEVFHAGGRVVDALFRSRLAGVWAVFVRTRDMGGAQADLPVARSVADMRGLLARLGPRDNGRFLSHDGEALAW